MEIANSDYLVSIWNDMLEASVVAENTETNSKLILTSLQGMCQYLDVLSLGVGHISEINMNIHVVSLLMSDNQQRRNAVSTATSSELFLIKDDKNAPIEAILDKLADCIHAKLNINGANNTVVVHCKAGISRSSAAICAYFIKYHSMTLSDALEKVRLARPIASPNEGFMLQIKDWSYKMKYCQE